MPTDDPNQPPTNDMPMTTAEADRLFAERLDAAEEARRQAGEAKRIRLSPEAAARVRAQRAAGLPDGPRMLPGMAMIALFLLVYALLNVFGAWRSMVGLERYGTLGICTLLVLGVFGLLRLKRWGWALMLGGCLFTSFSYVLRFITMHVPLSDKFGLLVYAGFFMVFFLYLVRDEVRSRVR